MGYETSVKWVKAIAFLDMFLSLLPITLYTVVTFLFGFMLMMGSYNTGYGFLDWILTNTMSVQDSRTLDFNNPGSDADIRMFRCSVWGISLLFNLLDLTLSFTLLHCIKRSKTSQPLMGWLMFRAFVIFTVIVLIIALLSTGSTFLSIFLSLIYLIYRCFGFWVVYKHVQNIRDEGGIP